MATSDTPDIGNEVDVESSDSEDIIALDVNDTGSTVDASSACTYVSIQCEILKPKDIRMSVFDFEDNATAMQYYSGFDNLQHLLMFFQILGVAVNHLSYKCAALKPIDQLFLTLMKLRQAKDDIELALFFKISETTVSCITRTWIIFLHFQLKEIEIWPSKKIVQEHMPEGFGRLFGSTRVILDATEIPIAKPTDVNAQSTTFSTYKNKNTLKTMIGCTPRGLVSFIGDSYGGSSSDRQLIERSTIYTEKGVFAPGDSIMADRGIMVQDLFANKDVTVNTPTMLEGKSQFEPHEIVHDRRIASKRIHIE